MSSDPKPTQPPAPDPAAGAPGSLTGTITAQALEQLHHEWAQLTTLQHSDRPFEHPLFAALATGLPVAVGVWFGHMGWGLVSSLGGMVFLYTPNTPMYHRMVVLMACAFGIAASYALGLGSHFLPWGVGRVLALTGIATAATMLARFYRIGQASGLFFVMAAAIGAYARIDFEQIPFYVGLVFMGAFLALLLAFAYSAWRLWGSASPPAAPPAASTFEVVILDSIIIGASVGLAQALAEALQFDRPYWASIACIVVAQGATFRAVWSKQLQRVLGTGIGLLLAGFLLALPLGPWGRCALLMAMTFVVETVVVRHYVIGAIFFTPMSVFLVEAASVTPDIGALIEARFYDTLLGSVIGMLGGAAIHHMGSRALIRRALERLMPARLVQLVRASRVRVE
jgi:uncharacterized membrane protein YccC